MSLRRGSHKRRNPLLRKILSIASAAALVVGVAGGMALSTAQSASAHTPAATDTCTTLSVNLTQYKDIVPAKDAVFTTEYQRYSWIGNPSLSDPATSSPVTEPGNWQADNKPDPGNDPIGQSFQQGNGVNASWFFWVANLVETSPATPAKVNTVTVSINGTQVDSAEFGASFIKDYTFTDSTIANSWSVTVVAWDGPSNSNWSKTITGTSEPCVPVDSCPVDFTSPAMWEINWGTSFDNRNGVPTFTTASNGGMTSLNGAALPSYMTNYDATHPGQNWHWLYVNKPVTNFGWTYGFADGTVRTSTITADSNGCPSVVWGETPPPPPPTPAATFSATAVCGSLTLGVTSVNMPSNRDYYYGVKAQDGDGVVLGSVVQKNDGTNTTTINFAEDSYGGTAHIKVYVHAATEWDYVPANLNYQSTYPVFGDKFIAVDVNTDCAPPPVVTQTITFANHTCGVTGTVGVPDVDGVRYEADLNGTVVGHVENFPAGTFYATDDGTSTGAPFYGTITINAFAKDGGVLKDGATTEWTYVFTRPDCDVTASATAVMPVCTGVDQSSVGTVTLTGEHLSWNIVAENATAAGPGGTLITGVPSGTYDQRLDGQNPLSDPYYGKVTVTPVADAGYTLTDATPTVFNIVEPDCSKKKPPVLAYTGVSSDSSATTGFALFLLFGGVSLVVAARALRRRKAAE